MFKVGEFYEDEAKTVAAYLKDAGLKVDIKGFVVARTEYLASFQGKLSELKEKLSDVEGMPELIEKRERYLSAMKAALEKGAVDETFRDIYLNELIPNWNEMLEKFRSPRDPPEEINEGSVEAGEISGDSDEISGEADEMVQDNLFETMVESVVSLDFAEKVMDLNELVFGSPVGNLLDDPVISLPADHDNCDSDDPLVYQRMEVNLGKMYEITIDEFSASLFDRIDEDFQEEFSREFLAIRSMGLVSMGVINAAEKGKMDIEEFADLCNFESGDRWHLSIDGSVVAEEIARSFEKMGMLKMKGNTIKWKG
ncbi:MAG: hypothetical protein LUQ59_02950 [Methanothrix sp.]|nr:hypothetical protein [Methanothrix sp.]